MQRWPQARAGLIALAICFGLIDGCPLPPSDRTPAWQRGFVEPIRRAQAIALTPVWPIGERLRIGQRWALYQGPRADKHRLWVEGRDATGQWHILFRAGDPEHTEDAELIDYTRPRGAWDPTTSVPMQYQLFAAWLTERILARHPDFIGARVQLERVRLTQDGVEPSGTFIEPYVRSRPRWRRQ